MIFDTRREIDRADEDLWVFGYGSLMWRPGFAFEERVPARLVGLHRALCVYSFVHRGTPEQPGLVLGLDRGGTCRGIAFRVDKTRRADTLAYLREREQTTNVYLELLRPVTLLDDPTLERGAGAGERRVRALVYAVDRSHPQYAGRLDLDAQVRLVRQGHGQSGPNRDYVLSTVREIEAQGCHDAKLHLLARRLTAGHETPGATPAA
ncbi:Cation transport protein [Rhodovulum sp. PH10]|uniref:gamma-glutamylcyclotransferase n=1 Tax=Rhodovulum sp. PH10 TaxID=1187851 RepID=UPI00027C2261|nr:gamma-glutamylcyclotransferase [Rhodovulum sp. PH10]EJW09585.1 Cation transport protein [Rhodovulum sp. PH10]